MVCEREICSLIDGRTIRADRRVEVAHVIEDSAQVTVRLGDGRVGNERSGERSHRAVEVAELVQSAAQQVMRFGEFAAVLRYNFLARFDHAAQIAVVVKRAREIEMSVGEDGLLFDRSLELLNRFFKLSCLI